MTSSLATVVVGDDPRLRAASLLDFNIVQVFSAAKSRDREGLGDRITAWLRSRPDVRVVDKAVLMSSDDEFHGLTIIVFAKKHGADLDRARDAVPAR